MILYFTDGVAPLIADHSFASSTTMQGRLICQDNPYNQGLNGSCVKFGEKSSRQKNLDFCEEKIIFYYIFAALYISVNK